jgi:hypothetical protein
MFMSQQLVEHIEACGILPLDSIFSSDHRPIFVNFNVFTIFDHPASGTERDALRDLQLNNPRLIDAYEEALCQKLVNHDIEFRVTLPFQIKELEWNNSVESLFNNIDRLRFYRRHRARKYKFVLHHNHTGNHENTHN